MIPNKIAIISFFLGGVLVFLGFSYAENLKTLEEEFDEDMEAKIEVINQANQSVIDLKNYPVGDGCEIDEEIQIITRRSSCSRQILKAKKTWKNLTEAEADVLKFLKEKDGQSLQDYSSCDATDLTWYELHCEADRIFIDERSYESLFKYFDLQGSTVLEEAKWVRVQSFEKKVRNPQWVTRSRLISPQMKLGDPWKGDKHPTENGTIIMLEQRLDGNIYISGVPVTGVLILEDEKNSEE